MNQVYKYTKNKAWDYDNMFEFETKELEQLMEKGINHIIPTNTMFIYVPIDTEMKLPGSESQRLVYYSQQYDYENTELQKINEFKIWAQMQGHELPGRDEEILRNLYARKWDNQAAYDAMIERQ